MLRSHPVEVKEGIFVSVGMELSLLVLWHQIGLFYHPLVIDNYGVQIE
jgi:hypothetical protein